MNVRCVRFVRGRPSSLLVGTALLALGCSGAGESSAESGIASPPLGIGGDSEAVAATSQAVVSGAWAYLRTPATKSGNVYQSINCSDCAKTSAGLAPQWATVGTGTYLVKLPGLAPDSTSGYVVHVSPFGTAGAECIVNGAAPSSTAPNDMILGVSCTNSLGSDSDTRFQLTYSVRGASAGALAADMAFAGVRNNALNGWYVNATPAPTLTRVTTGQYTIAFPGLRQAGKGGNAQVTSWTKGVRCNPIAWDASTTTGVKVYVNCATTFNVASDATFNVSYTKANLTFGDPGYVWMQDASNFGAQNPAPVWNKSYDLQDPDLLSSGMEVKRLSAGRYQVDFRRNGRGKTSQSLEITAVGDPAASCVVMSSDIDYAEVQCVKNGTPTNSQFSLRSGLLDRLASGWNLVSGINLFQNYGVGWGMLCGQVAIDTKQVMCGVSASPATVSMRVTGPAAWPDVVRYVAVDNRDLTTARVLVLGTDRVLRSTSGTLTKPWPAADNFTTASVVAQPIFKPDGSSLSLSKIVVVRDPSFNFVVGLTDNNRVVELSGTQWVASSYPIPSGVTWATISGDVGSLNLLATDGRMYRSVRGASSVTQLPALPSSLRAIGFGGDFVITNANMNASGIVPCVAPKNSAGFYDCGSTTQRFFKFTDYGTWSGVIGTGNIPLTNGNSVLTDGNPLTRPPAVEDARLVHGDAGKSFYTFHYNARVYHFL
jgi:hypothetical protein